MILSQYKQALVLLLSGMLLLGVSACNKVEEHANLIEKQPYIASTIVNGTGGYNYNSSYVVGDTAMLAGRLFIGQAGSSIHVGNVIPELISKMKVSLSQVNDRSGQHDSIDLVRFLITKNMAGDNVPLTVSANGYTIQGKPLTIRFINIGDRRTDTTLVVDQIGSWLPADITMFKQSAKASFVRNSSVAGDGTLYFDNNTGIYKLAGGQVAPVVLKGATVKGQGQQQFSIDVVLSSTVAKDGATLYYSAIVKENTPATADSLYITRLCKMDMHSGEVTTLNRSTVLKGSGTYQEMPGPFNGSVNAVKIVATNMQADISGGLWFLNQYFPVSNQKNPISRRLLNSTTDWYNILVRGNNDDQCQVGDLGNICVMDAGGQVTSLAQTVDLRVPGHKPFYSTPGPLVSNLSGNFMISPDGSGFYTLNAPASGFVNDIWRFSRSEGEVVSKLVYGVSPFNFTSFDTAVATHANTGASITIVDHDNFNLETVLPNNDILYAGHYSLYAYALTNGTLYCYAGTENQNAQLQTQVTGKAKYVRFDGSFYNVGLLRFCGVDRQGVVYYCTGGTYDMGSHNDFTNGVRFYKLHPAGK